MPMRRGARWPASRRVVDVRTVEPHVAGEAATGTSSCIRLRTRRIGRLPAAGRPDDRAHLTARGQGERDVADRAELAVVDRDVRPARLAGGGHGGGGSVGRVRSLAADGAAVAAALAPASRSRGPARHVEADRRGPGGSSIIVGTCGLSDGAADRSSANRTDVDDQDEHQQHERRRPRLVDEEVDRLSRVEVDEQSARSPSARRSRRRSPPGCRPRS